MALDSLDVRLLRIFVTIVEAGGFAAAQGELNLSLSTISNHISALESRLGLILCQRGRSGFRLTEEGRAVYEEAKRLFGTIDQFDIRMKGLQHRLNGTLSVGLIDNTLSDPASRLTPVFARMTDEAPEVALSIVTRPPHELLRDVITGELHIAIASFPRTTLGLEYVDLYEETQRFYCGAEHPLFSRDDSTIEIDDIRSYNLIGRSYWNARDLKIFSIANPRATVSDMEAEARLILSGRYLGYLPDHFASRYVSEGLLRPIRPDLFSYRAPFQAAFDKSRAKSGLVPFFVKLLTSEFGVAPSGRSVSRLRAGR
ncbi:LysR family transcriptional regulator [Ensifer adhaerens]|uniref:LysR family transcriptional regulator n=1 Tax=Ensifer adhaerens TaxID=106592 RepID=UPI003CE9ACDB